MINGRRNISRNSHPDAIYNKFTLAQFRVELRSLFFTAWTYRIENCLRVQKKGILTVK